MRVQWNMRIQWSVCSVMVLAAAIGCADRSQPTQAPEAEAPVAVEEPSAAEKPLASDVAEEPSAPTGNVPETAKEDEIMSDNMPRPSRPRPPKVVPIEHNGVRYQQDMQSSSYGGDQPGGYLVAIDPASGERLWMLKVYKVPVYDDEFVSSPGRHFRSMRLVPGRDEIEIENEVGGKYLVDLSERSAKWISGPDSVHKED